MLAPAIGKKGLDRLERALLAIPQRTPVKAAPPALGKPERAMGIREAMLSPGVSMPVEKSVGRILSAASVGCPPAVPIAVCGEVIDEAAVAAFRYYGIENCTVIK